MEAEIEMATVITDACICCGECVSECPNDAISEGEDRFVIDAARCTECVGFHDAEACQTVCPVECCVPDVQRPETESELLARARRLHPERPFPTPLPPALSRFADLASKM